MAARRLPGGHHQSRQRSPSPLVNGHHIALLPETPLLCVAPSLHRHHHGTAALHRPVTTVEAAVAAAIEETGIAVAVEAVIEGAGDTVGAGVGAEAAIAEKPSGVAAGAEVGARVAMVAGQ